VCSRVCVSAAMHAPGRRAGGLLPRWSATAAREGRRDVNLRISSRGSQLDRREGWMPMSVAAHPLQVRKVYRFGKPL
jgi:hypothetical protein